MNRIGKEVLGGTLATIMLFSGYEAVVGANKASTSDVSSLLKGIETQIRFMFDSDECVRIHNAVDYNAKDGEVGSYINSERNLELRKKMLTDPDSIKLDLLTDQWVINSDVSYTYKYPIEVRGYTTVRQLDGTYKYCKNP